MSLRRFKQKFSKVTGVVGGAIDAAKEKAGEMLDTSLDLDKAKAELVDDLEKGVRIFDEIGLPQEVGDDLQEQIAQFALSKLEEAWSHPERKTD